MLLLNLCSFPYFSKHMHSEKNSKKVLHNVESPSIITSSLAQSFCYSGCF